MKDIFQPRKIEERNRSEIKRLELKYNVNFDRISQKKFCKLLKTLLKRRTILIQIFMNTSSGLEYDPLELLHTCREFDFLRKTVLKEKIPILYKRMEKLEWEVDSTIWKIVENLLDNLS